MRFTTLACVLTLAGLLVVGIFGQSTATTINGDGSSAGSIDVESVPGVRDGGDNVYAVKFVCGNAFEEYVLGPGSYLTAINVVNVDSRRAAGIAATVAPTHPEDATNKPLTVPDLSPNGAVEIDCVNILEALEVGSPGLEVGLFKGFVILRSRRTTPLGVTAVYTYNPPPSGESNDVE